jgi:hypothetical protein
MNDQHLLIQLLEFVFRTPWTFFGFLLLWWTLIVVFGLTVGLLAEMFGGPKK